MLTSVCQMTSFLLRNAQLLVPFERQSHRGHEAASVVAVLKVNGNPISSVVPQLVAEVARQEQGSPKVDLVKYQ
jgi:hypothetical protein